MIVEVVRNKTSTNSNARLSIASIVEEVKEEEAIQWQQRDVEMLNVDPNFMTSVEIQKKYYNDLFNNNV